MTPGFTPQVAPSKQPVQVRFFQGTDLDDLQRRINEWLAAEPAREIVEVRQSGTADVLISVWYIG